MVLVRSTQAAGFCFALLLSCAAKAALLTEPGSGPSILAGTTAFLPSASASDPRQASPHWEDPPSSATAGGELDPARVSIWAIGTGGTSGGEELPDPTFDVRPIFGVMTGEILSAGRLDEGEPSPVPLPAGLWLLGSGVAALTPLLGRRARRRIPMGRS